MKRYSYLFLLLLLLFVVLPIAHLSCHLSYHLAFHASRYLHRHWRLRRCGGGLVSTPTSQPLLSASNPLTE